MQFRVLQTSDFRLQTSDGKNSKGKRTNAARPRMKLKLKMKMKSKMSANKL